MKSYKLNHPLETLFELLLGSLSMLANFLPQLANFLPQLLPQRLLPGLQLAHFLLELIHEYALFC